jgi:hypothetical protein
LLLVAIHFVLVDQYVLAFPLFVMV